MIGDWNGWHGGQTVLSPRGASGIWEGFVPDVGQGALYKYAIEGPTATTSTRPTRSRCAPRSRPKTGSVVWDLDYEWDDAAVDGRAPRPQLADGARCRSTRCTSARGGGGPRRATARSPTASWPTAGRLREAPRLHPRRAAAGDGAPVLRLVGLPDDRLLRARRARYGDAAGPDVPHRPPAPERASACILDWVPVALPRGRARAGSLRRHPPLRARRPAAGLPPRLEERDLQLRPQRGALVPALERDVLARRRTTPTACASTRWPRCCTSTTRATRASGSRTSTAGARTSTPSRSCGG